MTLDFGKKTRRNYHHVSVNGGYPIPLQTRLFGKSNCQNVEDYTKTGLVSEVTTRDRAMCLALRTGDRSNSTVTVTIAAEAAQDPAADKNAVPASKDNGSLLHLHEGIVDRVEIQ